MVHEVFQGTWIGPFLVLAPSRQRYISLLPDLEKTPTSYRGAEMSESIGSLFRGLVDRAKTWFDESWDVETLSNSPEPTSVSNETCIIQHALIDGNGILLTADAGPQALMEGGAICTHCRAAESSLHVTAVAHLALPTAKTYGRKRGDLGSGQTYGLWTDLGSR